MRSHRLPSVVLLCREEVVASTHETHVLERVTAAPARGVVVVKLQLVLLGPTASLPVHVTTATAVALVHGPPDGRGNVA